MKSTPASAPIAAATLIYPESEGDELMNYLPVINLKKIQHPIADT